MKIGFFAFICFTAVLMSDNSAAEQAPITIGSKNFNESYLLAEIYAQLLEANDIQVERKFGLGGKLVC